VLARRRCEHRYTRNLLHKSCLLSQLLLSLSRACLGKMVVLVHKWLRKGVLRTAPPTALLTSSPLVTSTTAAPLPNTDSPMLPKSAGTLPPGKVTLSSMSRQSPSAACSRSSLRKTHLFSQLFQCLSRACLGQMFVFIYKWLRKWGFSHPGA
jgi:hypothetical protein